jgi:lipopolysaccharide export system protein LptA
MKTSSLLRLRKAAVPLATAACLLATAWAQEARTAFRSKDGSLTLAPIGQFRVTQRPGQLVFAGKGPGLTATYNEYTLQAGEMNGTAAREGDKVDLRKMQTVGRTQGRFTNAEGRVETLSDQVTYTRGTPSQVELAGDTTITNVETRLSRTTKMMGKQAVLALDEAKKGRDQLRKATVAGSVRIELRQAATTGRGATKIDASGDRLAYEAKEAGAELRLTGNVKISGDGDAFSGSGEASVVIVRFDAAGQVQEVEMAGEPASTVLNRRGGGR